MVLAGAVALAVVLTVLALLAVRSASRRSRELGEALAQAETRAHDLAERLARLEQRAAEPAAERGHEDDRPVVHRAVVVDSSTGDPMAGEIVAERIDGRLFTDIVARETVIKAASWTHGVRRALAPEVRHRIRFEMRRELKRARKQRRADLKAALRDLQARERAAMQAEQERDRDEGDAA